jgi:hypothetical protein
MRPSEIRRALRAAWGAAPSSDEIAEGLQTSPDPDEERALAAFLSAATPARLGRIALDIAEVPGEKTPDAARVSALKFAHEMWLVCMSGSGSGGD